MKNNGFTLIELLGVFIIMAVLAIIITPIIASAINSAKISSRKESISLYGKEVSKMYVQDAYGDNPSLFDDATHGGVTTGNLITFSNKWVKDNILVSSTDVNCLSSSNDYDLSKISFDLNSKKAILTNCLVANQGYYSYYNDESVWKKKQS